MPEAHVINVAAISEFRASLGSFATSARQALVDLDLEVKRALDWVTRDRPAFWLNEARKAHEAVARAKDELANSRTYKRIGDFVPACLEEKKAVEIAKRRLEYAEKKVDTCKHWSMVVRRAVDEFQGPIQQLMGMLDGDIPQAMAILERMAVSLEQYISTPTPAATSWEQLTGEGEATMARPTDDAKDKDAKPETGSRSTAADGQVATTKAEEATFQQEAVKP